MKCDMRRLFEAGQVDDGHDERAHAEDALVQDAQYKRADVHGGGVVDGVLEDAWN